MENTKSIDSHQTSTDTPNRDFSSNNNENSDINEGIVVANPKIDDAILNFRKNVEALYSAAAMTLTIFSQMEEHFDDEFKKVRDDHGSVVKDDGETQSIEFPLEFAGDVNQRLRELHRSRTALAITPKSFILALISHYDAYLAELLKAIYYLKPEILSGSDKTLTFSELSEFNSIEDAREFIVERETESTLRESHAKQFEMLEKKFNVKLRSGLDIWPAFIELTERRNLFTHSGGKVSRQYLIVCKKHGVPIAEKLRPNDELDVDIDYFKNAIEIILEVGVKLGHVLWRKINDSDRESADTALNQTIYEYIQDKHYERAIKVADFAINVVPKHSSEQLRLYMYINMCNAYRLAGEKNECRRLLERIDWSALGNKYRLANAVLAEDYSSAADIMRAIGPSGEVNKYEYSDWPVFNEFRESSEFLDAYKDVYGEHYRIVTKDEKSDRINSGSE